MLRIVLLLFFVLLSIQSNAFESYLNQLIIHSKDKNHIEKIANYLKAKTFYTSKEEFKILMENEFKKLGLMDYKGKWKDERFEKISNKLIPPTNSAKARAFIDQIAKNLRKNNYFYMFINSVHLKELKTLSKLLRTYGKETIPRVVSYAMALDNLTKAQLEDPKIVKASLEVFKRVRKEEGISITDMNPFSAAKLASVENPIKKISEFQDKGKANPNFLETMLSVNILEATITDYILGVWKMSSGNWSNAKSSFPLIANPPNTPLFTEDLPESVLSEDGKEIFIKLPLARAWVDLYQTWNMAFVSQFKSFPYVISKLLIPSVSGYSDKPETYIYRRGLALYNHLHHVFLSEKFMQFSNTMEPDWNDDQLAEKWGHHNIEFAEDYINILEKVRSKDQLGQYLLEPYH